MRLFQGILIFIVGIGLIIFSKSVSPFWIPGTLGVMLLFIGGYLLFDYLEGK